MGYSIVTQLFPALVCSLFPRQVITKQGAIAGMGIGLLVVAYITLSGSTIATMFPGFPQYIKRFKCRYSCVINKYDCDVYR